MSGSELPAKLRADRLNVYYGDFHALKNISASISERRLTSLIGPSGCGKSTLLRVFNRMNDLIPSCRVEGTVELDGRPVYGPRVGIEGLRKRVGMVFQRPNPFPLTIRENVIYGPKVHALAAKAELDGIAERCLTAVGLFLILMLMALAFSNDIRRIFGLL